MKVEVIVFDHLGAHPGRTDLLRPKIDLPLGYSLKAQRKFMVLRSADGDLVLAIGPVIGLSYFHKDIVAAVKQFGSFQGLEPSGGGMATIEGGGAQGRWRITLSGESGDYGRFDPGLMSKESLPILKAELGMSVTIEWSKVF
jgi:hypothetical protein